MFILYLNIIFTEKEKSIRLKLFYHIVIFSVNRKNMTKKARQPKECEKKIKQSKMEKPQAPLPAPRKNAEEGFSS